MAKSRSPHRSERADRVVAVGFEQVELLRQNYLRPGHLLLAVALEAEESGTASGFEQLLGVPTGAVVDATRAAFDKGPKNPGRPPVYYTAEAAATLDIAGQEAASSDHGYVEPVHILLALLLQDDDTVAGVLRNLGADTGGARSRIAERLRSAGLLQTLTRDPGRDAVPVIGRAAEIDRVVQVLTRHRRRVPLLVGEPGIGKEAVTVGVARAVAERRVPDSLGGRTLRSLDLAAVLADPRHRARAGALIAELLAEVAGRRGLILHLDGALTPLHLPEGTTTPLGLFRSLLEEPAVRVIGDCGRAEYERRDRDPGLERLVQPVFLQEPPEDDVREILRVVRPRLMFHHEAGFTDDALEAAAALARDHVPDQALPGAAVSLLDEAAALVRTRRARSDAPSKEPHEVTEADVVQALAASSGIRTTRPRPAAARPTGQPVPHDPYVWTMS
ncbi:Clp protease N-terminal domain-containing protein [Streptomyces sp. NPDC047028]|uniref:Clp protease N-terminal domain-containing protein n=1 Tax=Streptomyces sp. NPDC047028 TaxID=3155793 RepID=UPI003410B5C2